MGEVNCWGNSDCLGFHERETGSIRSESERYGKAGVGVQIFHALSQSYLKSSGALLLLQLLLPT